MSISKLLLDILEELKIEDLKKFQWHLINSVEDDKRIPKSHLENTDRLDTVDKMVQKYGPNGAVEITLAILKKMNLNHLAAPLRTKHSENKAECDRVPIKDTYTEVYMIKGCTGGVNTKHEVRQVEEFCSKTETAVTLSDLFKVQSTENKHGTKVLTLGIAGVGKTVSVYKFILDWAEEKCNQDIDFIMYLPFRELNLIKDKKYNLSELLCYFHNELSGYEKEILNEKHRLLFILDGLDESKIPLDHYQKKVSIVTKKTSLDRLITNLINGELLPSAHLWITSRPSAVNKINYQYFNPVTEIRGFNDPQKEEYFRKRIRDQDQATTILSHIKTARSLYILCHIPVLCRISATVFQEILKNGADMKNAPTTLTEMYLHFLLFFTEQMTENYSIRQSTDNAGSSETRRAKVLDIVKLGKFAFHLLQKGQLLFYENDLKECGIDFQEALMYSGICTQIFKLGRKIYSFVHLSFQEFLAAVFVYLTLRDEGNPLLKTPLEKMKCLKHTLCDLLKTEVDKAMRSKNGHLDIFLRFLLGLSLESNQTLLSSLHPELEIRAESLEEIVNYIKKIINRSKSFEKTFNLFHCLSELNDNSLTSEIQNFLHSGDLATQTLSSAQCSALVFVLVRSEEIQEKFELKKFRPSDKGLKGLLPVVKNTRRALLSGCGLTEESCKSLTSILQLKSSTLIKLEMNNNDLQDSGVNHLCAGLKSPHCKLEILRLSGCGLTEESCKSLASVLQTENSTLRELEMNNNNLQDSGLLIHHPLTELHYLLYLLFYRLSGCGLTEESCKSLTSVLQTENSLRELEMNNNDLQNSGVEKLCAGLKSSHCKLEILRLSGCLVTKEGCSSLASALRSNPSHLKELDLTYNHPGESGVKLLCARLEDSHCKLDTLRVEHAGEIRIKPGLRKYVCDLTLDPNTAHTRLSLPEGNRKVTCVWEQQSYPEHPERFDHWYQVLCRESLTGRCYWEVEWSGRGADISVTYKGISRKGVSGDCEFGCNVKSWRLSCSNNRYTVTHNKKKTVISATSSSNRVGVYLDWPAGTLSFYSVSSHTHTYTHLHTIHSTFTEPLYAGFGLWGSDSSVCVCKVE
uniref:B30.2/SPRY domain-containing protein n=1 Tax=Electrophorus electricus TaxID=8005 RepID=A0AAY5EIV3_ELEEL